MSDTRKFTRVDNEDIHMGEPGLLHKLFRKRKLEGFFLFVTSNCNSRCRTCFYHDRLNAGDDLTFQQIETMSRTAPSFDKLWLSGGEPVLREDLVDILELFYVNNGSRVINFPTNGLRPDLIERHLEELFKRCPDYTVHLNFSLDGPGEVHDQIRGIPGNFEKTISSMNQIHESFGHDKRLLINAATVVTREGYDHLMNLADYLVDTGITATHFMEILRGEPRDESTGGVSREQVEHLHDRMMPLYEIMGDRLFSEFTGNKKRFARFFFLGFLRFVMDIQDANVERPSHWGMKCTAGKTTLVVDANGDFRSCEMRPPVGNMKEYGYNVDRAFHSEAMKEEIRAISGGTRANCWCTHSCWIMSSLKFSPRALLIRIPAAAWRYLKNREETPLTREEKRTPEGVRP
jgi:sulfatase maturation enzyme AslB (radical SAM superfamily)